MVQPIHWISIISAILGFLSIFYLSTVVFQLKGGLKKAMFFILLGIISGYLVILTIVLSDFSILSFNSSQIFTIFESLLAIAFFFILFGSYKMQNIVKYLPDYFLKIIDDVNKKSL